MRFVLVNDRVWGKGYKKKGRGTIKRIATEIRNFVGEDFFGNFNNGFTYGAFGKSSLYTPY